MEFCEDYPNARIVITCRRNFYESEGENYNGTLKGFEEYILTNITNDNIIESLKKYNINVNEFYREISLKKLDYLIYNPFYLNELIQFFNIDEKLPEKSVLLDKIIEKSFSLDKNKYDTNSLKLRELLKNIALSLEILGRNYLSEEEYYKLINNCNDIELLQCSSLWQKNDDTWSFKHNNFGEYLASQKLKEYSIDDIKNMVCYKNINDKIKPSWINTLTFFVNNDKNQELVKWILECMPEFFVYIEDGIVDLKSKQKLFWQVFSQYKKKKVWIEYNIYNSNNIITCKEDIENLINEINENYHYTSVGNALHILKNVNSLFGMEQQLKKTLIDLIQNSNYSQYNKSIAIEILGERKIIDFEEFIKIVEINKNNESSNLRKSYFYCCNIMNIVDETIDLLLDKFEIETIGMTFNCDDESDDCYYWNEHKEYEETFSNIKNKETVEKIISFFESKKLYNRESNCQILDNLMKSILRIYIESDEFIDICIKLYTSYEKDYNYKCMNCIIDTIKEKNLMLDFFKKYMKNNTNKSLLWYKKIIDDDCLNYYCKAYEDGEFNEDETKYILRFSNKNLLNYKKLKKIYEDKTGDIIQENVAVDYKKIEIESMQYFINKLFKKDIFIQFVEDFKIEFQQKYKCKEILVKDLLEYKYRVLTSENNKYYYLCNFLIRCLKDDEIVDTSKIKNWNWEHVILGELYKILNNEKVKITLSNQQIIDVEKICNKLLLQVDFRKSITYSGKDTFSVSWLSIYLFFFRYKFDFKYPENILLDMLEFDWQIDGKYVGIKYIINNVSPIKIKERIIENLNKKKIRSQIFINHVKYCIENDIYECIEAVGEYLSKKSFYLGERKISTEYLLRYIKIEDFTYKYLDNNSILFQKEILGYIPNTKKKKIYKWILKRNKECRRIQDKMFFAQQLIYIGRIEGIEYYYNWAKENMCPYENKISYKDINEAISEINSIEMINILIDFLDLTLNANFKDKRFNGLYNNLSKAIQNIGSKKENNFIIIKNKLLNLFNIKKEYEDIGKIQYLIQDMEYNYIANLQNDENIESIKCILKK